MGRFVVLNYCKGDIKYSAFCFTSNIYLPVMRTEPLQGSYIILSNCWVLGLLIFISPCSHQHGSQEQVYLQVQEIWTWLQEMKEDFRTETVSRAHFIYFLSLTYSPTHWVSADTLTTILVHQSLFISYSAFISFN